MAYVIQPQTMSNDYALAQKAKSQGYQETDNGGFWRRYNGGTQDFTAGQLRNNLGAQDYVKGVMGGGQGSAKAMVDGGGTDYMAMLAPYLQKMSGQQGGASTIDQSNPYEQQLQALTANPDSIANTNAYKFRFNQGQQALERSSAAKGMLNSGNTLAALADYGSGLASQEYGNEASRLGALTGQQNNYNLGRMGAANTEFAQRANNLQSLAGLALSGSRGSFADRSAADDSSYRDRALGANMAVQSGYVSPRIW